MRRAFSTILAGAIGAALPANFAGAQPGMPAGTRQWLSFDANWNTGVGYVGAFPYPSPNYTTGAAASTGQLAYVNGDSTANRMRSSYWLYGVGASGSIFYYNSMNDTYTISGPAGTEGTPVEARVIFHAKGALFVSQTYPTTPSIRYYGGSHIDIEVGGWNPSTESNFYEPSRVGAFDSTWTARADIPFSNHGSNPPAPLMADIVVDKILTPAVGQPFDLAFGLNVGDMGCGDLSGSPAPSDSEYAVATIEWILPEGYSITSALGYTPFCGADYNKDGFVTGDDFDAFTADFDAGNAAADVNHDGFTTGDDFDFFSQHFDAGC